MNVYSGHIKKSGLSQIKNSDCHNKNPDSPTKIRTVTKKIWTFLYKNFLINNNVILANNKKWNFEKLEAWVLANNKATLWWKNNFQSWT